MKCMPTDEECTHQSTGAPGTALGYPRRPRGQCHCTCPTHGPRHSHTERSLFERPVTGAHGHQHGTNAIKQYATMHNVHQQWAGGGGGGAPERDRKNVPSSGPPTQCTSTVTPPKKCGITRQDPILQTPDPNAQEGARSRGTWLPAADVRVHPESVGGAEAGVGGSC